MKGYEGQLSEADLSVYRGARAIMGAVLAVGFIGLALIVPSEPTQAEVATSERSAPQPSGESEGNVFEYS